MTDIDKAIKVLYDNYERAMKLDYVRNKIVWALNKTWLYFNFAKEMDEEVSK